MIYLWNANIYDIKKIINNFLGLFSKKRMGLKQNNFIESRNSDLQNNIFFNSFVVFLKSKLENNSYKHQKQQFVSVPFQKTN